MKKSGKTQGALMPNQVRSSLIAGELGSNTYHWVQIIDFNKAELTPLMKHNFQRLLLIGEMPIVIAPHLSDYSGKSHRCAEAVKVTVVENRLYALLKPLGRKARIFKQMIQDNRMITVTVAGTGEYNRHIKWNDKLPLSKIQYIRLDFIK